MTNFTYQPKDAQDALRYAKSFEKAQEVAKTYTFVEDKEIETVYIYKPENTGVFDHSILMGECSCPDFQQRGSYCKHTLAWTLIQQAEEEAKGEAEMIAQYEKEQADCEIETTGTDYRI